AGRGCTALQAASGCGDLQIVERLIESGVGINAEARSNGGGTALQAAAEGGHSSVVERLFEAGGDINARPAATDGVYVFGAAVSSGSIQVIKAVSKDGKLFTSSPEQHTKRPLSAIWSEHPQSIVKILRRVKLF